MADFMPVRRSGGGLIRSASEDSDFIRRANPAPGTYPGAAIAQSLIRANPIPAAKTGWKLFSPSTWWGIRDTAWGRRKAAQRRIAQLDSHMTKLGSLLKTVDPRSGFFSDATAAPGRGRGITGDEALDDPNSGLSPAATAAWGRWATAHGEASRASTDEAQGRALAGGFGAWEESGMGKDAFLDLALMRDRRKVSAADDSVKPLDEFGRLESPGHDDQDFDGDGIPDVVRHVMGGGDQKAAATGARGSSGQQNADLDSIDDNDDDVANDYQEDFMKGVSADEYNRAMKNLFN